MGVIFIVRVRSYVDFMLPTGLLPLHGIGFGHCGFVLRAVAGEVVPVADPAPFAVLWHPRLLLLCLLSIAGLLLMLFVLWGLFTP